MKLQVLLIACDDICIKKTILTWACASRIVVLANGPEADKIIINLTGVKNCFVIKGEFIGFSNTRNLLIEMAQCDKFDYNIMIDDSYELRGDLILQLEKQTLNYGIIKVKSGEYIQNRKIIFKNGKYSGNIHETLISHGEFFNVEDCFIEDVIYSHHLKRTNERAEYDLLMLDKEPDTRRTRYYRGTLLLKKEEVNKSIEIFNSLIKENIDDLYDSLSRKIKSMF